MGKILDVVFPMIANHKANKALYEKIHPKNEAREDIKPAGVLCNVDNADKFSMETLKEQYAATFKTKDKLEDKAKTNIIGITISITLIMGASGILSTLNKKYSSLLLSWILFALFLITVAYMLTAGLLVIRLLISENEIYVVKLNSLASGGMELRDDYDMCISLNQIKNTIRNNHIFTSYECIRNALVCLFIVLVLVAVPINMPKDNTDKELIYSSQSYSFLFSSSAVDYLKDNEIRDAVEKVIVSTINTSKPNEETQTFGIVDNRNNLFIKFQVADIVVTVLIIEPYTMP